LKFRPTRLDDLGFWLLANSLVLAYVGSSELLFRYGPGAVYSALGVAVAGGYLALARLRQDNPVRWLRWLALVTPVAVLVGDLILTSGWTSLDAVVIVASLILIFQAYRQLGSAPGPSSTRQRET